MGRLGLTILAGVFSLLGCGGDDSNPVEPVLDEGEEKCPADLPAFATGDRGGLLVPVRGTGLELRLIDAEHQPPKKDYNTWTVALLDADGGGAASDAVITWACAFMEVHRHGSNPKAVEALGDGQFKLVDQNLSMTGPWALRLWIDPSGKEPLYEPRGSTVLNGMACVPSSGLKGAYNAEIRFCVPSTIAH